MYYFKLFCFMIFILCIIGLMLLGFLFLAILLSDFIPLAPGAVAGVMIFTLAAVLVFVIIWNVWHERD